MKYTKRLKKIVNFFDTIYKIGYVCCIIGFIFYGILLILLGIYSALGNIDWTLGLNTTIVPYLEEV